jgi:hypothetical protein
MIKSPNIVTFSVVIKAAKDKDAGKPLMSKVEDAIVDVLYDLNSNFNVEEVAMKVHWPDGTTESWTPRTVPEQAHYKADE